MSTNPAELWVVAACFNEATGITRFMETVLAQAEVDRLLLVDDGSSDASVSTIRNWMERHPQAPVSLVELTRNFGKEAAMLAGLDQALGQ